MRDESDFARSLIILSPLQNSMRYETIELYGAEESSARSQFERMPTNSTVP